MLAHVEDTTIYRESLHKLNGVRDEGDIFGTTEHRDHRPPLWGHKLKQAGLTKQWLFPLHFVSNKPCKGLVQN